MQEETCVNLQSSRGRECTKKGLSKAILTPFKGLGHPCSNSLNLRWYLLLIASGPGVSGYFCLFNFFFSSNAHGLGKEGHYLGLHTD